MSEGPDDRPLSVQLPSSGTGARARNREVRKKQRRTQQAWFTAAVVVLAAAIPVLGYIGFHRIITTTEGRRVDPQNDPSKPNYEVDVVPTPVALVVQTDADNKLTGLTMLSLGANDTGGGALFIPPAIVTFDIPPETDADPAVSTSTTTTRPSSSNTPPGTTTLAAAYEQKGLDGLTQLTANVVGLSFGEVIFVTDDQMAQFIEPLGSLTIDNPDRLVVTSSSGKSSEQFPSGSVTLQPTDVPVYLAARNPGESDLGRLARQQPVWQAWLAAIRSSDNPNVIPGEQTEGLGRYLRGLAAGDVQFATLPVTETEDLKGNETFNPSVVEPVVRSLVPLPTPANPGDRLRVRLLSGVGPLDVNAMLATQLVPAKAQVVIVGNADRFDYAQSQIVYYDDAFADTANQLQQALGLGEVQKRATATDTEDLTLIIGQDLVAKQNLAITKGDGSG